MGKLHAFAHARKYDRVVTDNIAAPHGMHPKFGRGSLADNAFAAVADDFIELLFPDLREDLSERARSTAGRVAFKTMMHLHNLQIEIGPQNLRRFARKPK